MFFKPKDIVSGDFYWVEKGNEDSVYMAVVDCTGHGVPGAFMSIVGFNLLSKAIHENKCDTPADILQQVNIDLTETLKQTLETSSVKDGMEISLCKWNKKNNELLFAGANTIVYHVSDKQMNIIKGNKHPIGGFYGEQLKPFQNIKINVDAGDCVYLFSDGYADQFGGEKGKKYKYKQLEEFLLSNSDKPVIEQQELLANEFERWRGYLEQVDDVCVLGVKF
ncbi:MAG TPA: SpoIIE family protein phosphatase [Bacteroidia bacterium]|nr:SpoIIE family protein phosphatase [Bacteroidia bacterium]